MKIKQRIEQAKTNWKRLCEGWTPLIFVGSATCGLASGAGEVTEAIHKELKRLRVKAEVIPVGCIGMCFAEPLVDIKMPGQPRICYSEVTPEKITKILKSHLKNSKPLTRYAISRNSAMA